MYMEDDPRVQVDFLRVVSREQKIAFFGRFFGEKSVFGGNG